MDLCGWQGGLEKAAQECLSTIYKLNNGTKYITGSVYSGLMQKRV